MAVAGRWIGILGPVGDTGTSPLDAVGACGDCIVSGHIFHCADGGYIWPVLLAWVVGGCWDRVVGGRPCEAIHCVHREELEIDGWYG
jgi:hypothetical protein